MLASTRSLLFTLATAALLGIASSQDTSEIGIDICHCQPDTITFDLNFAFVCPDSNVEGPGILDTACLIDTRGESLSDRVPNSITEVQVFELDGNSAILNQAVFDGPFTDGASITYTSIVKSAPENITNADLLPLGFQVTMSAINQFEEVLVNTWIIQYTGNCGIFPLIEIGEQIGWSRFTDLGAPSTNFCPVSIDDDPLETDAPVVAPTDAPAVVPTDAPAVAPTVSTTDVPVVVPTDAPVVPNTNVTDAPTKSPVSSVTYPPHCPQYYDDDDDDSGKAGKGGKGGSGKGKAGSGEGEAESGKGKGGSGKGKAGSGKAAGGMTKLPEEGMTESNSAKSSSKGKATRHSRYLAAGSTATFDDCPAPIRRGKGGGKAGGKAGSKTSGKGMKVEDEGRTEDLSGKGKGGKAGKGASMNSMEDGKSMKSGKAGSSTSVKSGKGSAALASGKGGMGTSSGKGSVKMPSEMADDDLDGSDGYVVNPGMASTTMNGKGSSSGKGSVKGGSAASSGKGSVKMPSDMDEDDMDGSDGYPLTPGMASSNGKGGKGTSSGKGSVKGGVVDTGRTETVDSGKGSTSKASSGKGSMDPDMDYEMSGKGGSKSTLASGKGSAAKASSDEDMPSSGKGGKGVKRHLIRR